MSFDSLGLDARLLRALGKRGLAAPLPVQTECIPRALEGRDIVARARTGSGKTLAYLLPALHRILTSGKGRAGWQALVLVPTRELCDQVRQEAAALAEHCGADLAVSAISAEGTAARSAAATAGQLVVSTPARVAALLREGALTQRTLERSLCALVLDEADLLLSYGYEEDVAALAPAIPRSCQCMLMSATTSEDVERLSALVLHNPISLDLLHSGATGAGGSGEGDGAADAGGAAAEISHFRIDLPAACAGSVAAETVERLLHLLTLLRLALVQRKVLIFVNSAESGMRVRLFLDAFGVRCSVLSADLPLNSRHHILQEFNRGLFDFLVATDDVHAADAPAPPVKRRKGRQPGGGGGRGRGARKDEEFGVTRGIDFKGVATVINFDMPASVQGYVHRVGRTGRAGEAGLALTLLAPSDLPFAAALERGLTSTTTTTTTTTPAAGAAPASDAGSSQLPSADGGAAPVLQPFARITRAAVEGLRYRAEDVARSITKSVIREARAKDLKAELLNSKRLAAFFEERPADLQLLRHDRPLAASAAAGAAAPHLKSLPAYLRDPTLHGKSFIGGGSVGPKRGAGLGQRQRRKVEGVDPVKGFARAPKRGGDRLEAPTELELRAEAGAKRDRKELKKKAAAGMAVPGADPTFKPKQNVRKNKVRKR